MKKLIKINKDIVIMILLFIVFLVAVFFTSDQSSVSHPDYTVFSSADNGVSLLFDTYKNMELPVEIYLKSIEYADTENIQIIIQPNEEFETDEEYSKIAEFVSLGGNAVYIAGNSKFFSYISGTGETFELLEQDTMSKPALYSYGKGQIIHAYGDLFTNKSLFNNRAAGLELLKLLSEYGWSYDKIYFNEYYHGYGQKTNLWVALPVWAKQTVFMTLLVAALVVIYLGKRFGKAKPYFEELERDENEYAVAVGRLYYNALLYKKTADNYFYDFVYRCCVFFKINANSDMPTKIDIIGRSWNECNFSESAMLEEVLKYEQIYKMDSDAQINKSEFKSFIHSIERLNTIIKEGSDYKWH